MLLLNNSDYSTIISKLNSKSHQEVAEAAEKLMSLGRDALPALNSSLDNNDQIIRQRSASLIRQIEIADLVRPTAIRLNFQNQPMVDIIRDITDRTGCRIRIYEGRKDWLSQEITLREEHPVPFWKAIDLICDAGQFQYNLGVDGYGPCISLFRDKFAGPSSDDGAFRVLMEEVRYNGRFRQLHLGQDVESRPTNQLENAIRLRIMAEPRTFIRAESKITNLHITDTQNQPVSGSSSILNNQSLVNYFSGPYFNVDINFRDNDLHMKEIRTLQAVIPVAVARLSSKPLVIPLDAVEGRTYHAKETSITVQRIEKIPVQKDEVLDGNVRNLNIFHFGLHVVIKQNEQSIDPIIGPTPISRANSEIGSKDLLSAQFEIVDSDDQTWSPAPFLLGAKPSKEADGIHVKLLFRNKEFELMPWTTKTSRLNLNYYDITKTKHDIIFSFKNIQLPRSE